MDIQCPSCRKVNTDSPECKRCGCDLSLLAAVVNAAYAEAVKARDCLMARDAAGALAAAQRAWNLRHNVVPAQLAFLACVAQGRYEEACLWYGRARGDAKDRRQ